MDRLPTDLDSKLAVSDSLRGELEKRKTSEPLRYVKFNKATNRYAHSWCDPSKTIVLFAAPNAIGKTYATIALLGWSIWPEYCPIEFKESLLRKISDIDQSFRLCSTTEEASQSGSIQEAIKKLWPKGRWSAEKNRKAFESVFKTDNGWIGDVMTYEQDPEEFEGATRGIIIYNEPPPKEVRKRCVQRTRMGGFEVFPMTPLSNAAWIKDDLVDRALTDKKIAVLTGDIEDACIQHGTNGHLSHKRISELLEEMDPDEIEARAHGKFMHLSGVIFKSFKREVHVPQQEIIPPGEAEIFMVVDPAIGKPMACIWAYMGTDKIVRIFDEYPNEPFEGAKDSNLTLEDYSVIFKRKEAGRLVACRILDRHFGNTRRTPGSTTFKMEFIEASSKVVGGRGYDFIDSYKLEAEVEVETGILKIKEYLDWNKRQQLSNLNRPKLEISPNCKNTILALERWSRHPETGKPKEDYKDFIDCVRYLLMADLSPRVRNVWNQTKLPFFSVGV